MAEESQLAAGTGIWLHRAVPTCLSTFLCPWSRTLTLHCGQAPPRGTEALQNGFCSSVHLPESLAPSKGPEHCGPFL